jgi:hypothetical protein
LEDDGKNDDLIEKNQKDDFDEMQQHEENEEENGMDIED